MHKLNEKKTIFVAAIMSYLTMALSVLISLFYTPFVLERLGDVEYGIRSFAASISGYLVLLSLGMNSAFFRFLSLAKKEEGEEGEKKAYGLFLFIFLIVGIVSFIIGTILAVVIYTGVIPLSQYSESERHMVAIILGISVIGVSLDFPGMVFRLMSSYKRRFIWTHFVDLVITVLTPALSVIILFTNYGNAIALSWVALSISLLSIIMNICFVAIKLKFKPTFKFIRQDKKRFFDIVKFSFFVFIIITLSRLNTITDKVVLGFVMTPIDVTIYSLSVVFVAYLAAMSSAITDLFSPRIMQDAVDGNMDKVQRVYDFVSKVIIIILTCIVFGFLATGQQFIIAWIGYDRQYIFYYSLVILASNLLLVGQSFSFSIQRGLNKNKIPALIYAIVFIINVGLSIGLCYVFGIWGCIIGTVFSYVVESIALSIYNSKSLHLKQSRYWFSLLGNSIIAAISALVVLVVFYFADIRFLSYGIQTIIRGSFFLLIFIPLQIVINGKFFKNFFLALRSKNNTIFFDRPAPETLEVLVVTMNRNKDQIIELCKKMNMETNAIIANQCDSEGTYTTKFNNHSIKVISSRTRGVSVNRNICLQNLGADVGIFMDDDCELISGYEQRIIKLFADRNLDAAVINGFTSQEGTERVRNRKSKMAKLFFDVSFGGGPGLCIRKAAIKYFNLSFCEKVGTPNYLYAGEDSLFIYDIFNKNCIIYRDGEPIYKIIVDMEDSSTYFKGFDEQYFATKGAIMKLTHPITYWLIILYYDVRYIAISNKKPWAIHNMIRKGWRLIKKGKVIDK
ncbi:MAG: oligosaccharide flippase family protein [Bacilli bacterium]|nr:oligosaccharide flippase family protein [Bacilli bacterium]